MREMIFEKYVLFFTRFLPLTIAKLISKVVYQIHILIWISIYHVFT